MDKRVLVIIAAVCFSVTAVLSARDFRDYGIGDNVSEYPELGLDNVYDDIWVNDSSDEITQYCGIFSKNMVITADISGDIISKSITLEGKSYEYASQVFNVWNDRLKSVFDHPKAVIIDKVPWENTDIADAALQNFFTDGKSIEFAYHGQTTINVVGLKRYETDNGIKYDVSIFVTSR